MHMHMHGTYTGILRANEEVLSPPQSRFSIKGSSRKLFAQISNRETQCSAVQAIQSRLYLFDAIAGYSKTGWSLSLYELELVSLANLILVITD